jgi:hypothetical protein
MASTSAAALLIVAAHLLDPRSGNVLSPAAVLVALSSDRDHSRVIGIQKHMNNN